MRRFQRTSLLVLSVLFGVSACLLPTVTIVDPNAQATSFAQTVQVMIVQTQQASGATTAPGLPSPAAPTATSAPSQTPTQTMTATQAATSTPIVILTVTPLFATISVSVPTNCREGPATVYPAVDYLLVGETAQIYARDPTGTWWYIRNPDDPSGYCWVSGKYATISGSTAFLPVYTPMPTPTATLTPTASPGFDMSYESLISCTGAWWPEIRLDNTGVITFQSMSFMLTDNATDVTVSYAIDGFPNRPDCSTMTSRDTLPPGKHTTVNGPTLPDDPSGHKLKATVTLCSKTGQNGTCITQSLTFKP